MIAENLPALIVVVPLLAGLRPLGAVDIERIGGLLESVQPHQVYAAGDLSDPHGTHRLCKQAIDLALERCDSCHPEVWLYRGAWQEWPITEADVLVPLSQEELRLGGLRIDPRTNIGSRTTYYNNLRIRFLNDKKGDILDVEGMPDRTLVGGMLERYLDLLYKV